MNGKAARSEFHRAAWRLEFQVFALVGFHPSPESHTDGKMRCIPGIKGLSNHIQGTSEKPLSYGVPMRAKLPSGAPVINTRSRTAP